MKKLLAVLLVLLLILAGGIAWLLMSFHFIDGQLYPKKAETLNLHGRDVSLSHYESLRQKMPETEIFWDVPFQGRTYPNSITELVTPDLTTDMEMLPYFPALETIDARGCEDPGQLVTLRGLYPDLKILMDVTLNGKTYGYDAESIELSSVTEEEIALLPFLVDLRQVTVGEGGDATHFPELKEYCEANDIDFRIILFGDTVDETAAELTVSHVSENQLQLMGLMPWLKAIHLQEPEAPAQAVFALQEALPDTAVTWEKTVLGVTFDQNAVDIDLTSVIARAEGESPDAKTAWQYGLELPVMCEREEVQSAVKVTDRHPLPDKTDKTADILAELEAAMAYFPKAETLTLVGAWLDNEAMSQFREAHRQDFKVVWTVEIGNLATRTDAAIFMPTKFFVNAGSIADWHTVNLKYCEDMVAMDIGHMTIAELDFVRYMPKLTYLDIALNHITDLSALESCKNLKFLVMHSLSMELDYTPLLGCTALEDLNISDNPGDISPVFRMKHLKNLWMTGCSYADYTAAKAALPDTHIGYGYSNPNSGWRSLPNYFKMRDELLMFYMS